MALIIFDLDGTLFQTHKTSVAAVNRALAEAGLPPQPQDLIISLFGEKGDVFYSTLAPGLSPRELDIFADKVRQYERQGAQAGGMLYPGTVDMLEVLAHEGHSLAVCSNASLEYVEIVLAACGIRSFFSEVRGREEDTEKTAVIARMIQCHPLAMVVGDRKHDFAAARENRIVSIAARYGYGEDESGLADFQAQDILEVLYYIRWCAVCGQAAAYIRDKQPNRPFIVGISGVDTSGKTRFTDILCRYLRAMGYPVQCVHLDDFHHPAAIRNQLQDPVQSYIQYAFDMDTLTKELLDPVREGRAVKKLLPVLSLITDALTEERQYDITGDTVVLLEGVLLFRPPLDSYLDMRIWLDISFGEVMKRAEARDVPLYGAQMLDRYREKYIPVQEWFINRYTPQEVSDLVIDNTNPQKPLI